METTNEKLNISREKHQLILDEIQRILTLPDTGAPEHSFKLTTCFRTGRKRKSTKKQTFSDEILNDLIERRRNGATYMQLVDVLRERNIATSYATVRRCLLNSYESD